MVDLAEAKKVDETKLKAQGWNLWSEVALKRDESSPVETSFAKALEAFIFRQVCFGALQDRHKDCLCWQKKEGGQFWDWPIAGKPNPDFQLTFLGST